MWCFRCKRLLIPYSEGETDERTRDKVERHLAKCERCASDLEAIRCVSDALLASEGPNVEPAPDLWANVSARIAHEAPPRPRRVWLRSPQAISAAAAAVLIAAVGLTMVRMDIGTRQDVPEPAARITGAGNHRPVPAEEPKRTGTAALAPMKAPEQPTVAEGPVAAPTGRADYLGRLDEVVVADAAPGPREAERPRVPKMSTTKRAPVAERSRPDLEEVDLDSTHLAAAGVMADRSIVGAPLPSEAAPTSPAAAAPADEAVMTDYYHDADIAARPDVRGTESVVDALNES